MRYRQAYTGVGGGGGAGTKYDCSNCSNVMFTAVAMHEKPSGPFVQPDAPCPLQPYRTYALDGPPLDGEAPPQLSQHMSESVESWSHIVRKGKLKLARPLAKFCAALFITHEAVLMSPAEGIIKGVAFGAFEDSQSSKLRLRCK